MMFLLAAAYLAQYSRFSNGQAHWVARAGMLFAASVSLLCKEVYLPVVVAVLLVDAWRNRDYWLGVETGILVAFYGTYRVLMVGSSVDYTGRFLNALEYFRFFTKLPYTMSSNYGGYCVLGIIFWLAITYMRSSEKNYWTILWMAALIASSLAVIVPVSFPLYTTIRRPDPWYRIVFVLNTLLLCFGGYLAVRTTSRRNQIILAAVVLAVIIPGAEKTRRLWVTLTVSAEREAKFYLNNPDKVLLSEQEGWWFIPGVHKMYSVAPAHYVLLKDVSDGERGQQQIVVWRYRDGKFVPQSAWTAHPHP
jgi:hypothetical protein